jgi:hypothetical protein
MFGAERAGRVCRYGDPADTPVVGICGAASAGIAGFAGVAAADDGSGARPPGKG